MNKNNKSNAAGIIGLVILLALVAFIKATNQEATGNKEEVQDEQPQSN